MEEASETDHLLQLQLRVGNPSTPLVGDWCTDFDGCTFEYFYDSDTKTAEWVDVSSWVAGGYRARGRCVPYPIVTQHELVRLEKLEDDYRLAWTKILHESNAIIDLIRKQMRDELDRVLDTWQNEFFFGSDQPTGIRNTPGDIWVIDPDSRVEWPQASTGSDDGRVGVPSSVHSWSGRVELHDDERDRLLLAQAHGRIDRLDTLFRDLYYYYLISQSWIDKAIQRSLKSKETFNERKYAGLMKK
jgi:hypothetical protein